jgi:hypothetical protein
MAIESALHRYMSLDKEEREKMLLHAAEDAAELYREGGLLYFGDIIDYIEEPSSP